MRYPVVIILALTASMPAPRATCAGDSDSDTTAVIAVTDAAEGLDLHAVGELFKDSGNLEEFEAALNNPNTGVNNVDLDDNGKVEYLRVVEEVSGDTHVVAVQASLGADDFQDVATIEVEKTAEDVCDMQVHGAEIIYGPGCYVAAPAVQVHAWPTIVRMYGPGYHPYRSAWYFRHYPAGWRPWHPVAARVYRTRTVVFRRRAGFRVVHTTRVTTVSHVRYHPMTSTRVKRTKVTVRRGAHATTVKRTTVHRRRR